MNHFIARALVTMLCAVSTAAWAAPMPAADAAHLEGDWRINGDTKSDACGRDGNFLYGSTLAMEFRLTGGQVFIDDGSEGMAPQRVLSSEKNGGEIRLKLDGEDDVLRLKAVGKNRLTVVDGPGGFYGAKGKTFTQCLAGEARSAIKLDRADMNFLATTMLPSVPRFVDARVKAGCKAGQYQYLSFDLATSTFPELRRESSDALGAALAAKKKISVPVDSDRLGRWTIDGAVKTANGYTFTVTELIPPNGSRGDQSKLEILRTKDGISVPSWKRSYVRCDSKARDEGQ